MIKVFKFCLAAAMLLGFTFSCFAQSAPLAGFYSQGSYQQQEERIRQLKKENPELAKLEEKLLTINNEIQEILRDHQKGKLSKGAARKKIRPLMIKSLEITTSLEYLAEMQVDMMLYAPPIQ